MMIHENKAGKLWLKTLLLVLCCALAVMTAAIPVLAKQTAMSGVTIENEYEFGTVFTVPERTVTAGGETVPMTHTVVYPDGTSTLKSEITLNMSGVYTVCYQAFAGGKPYADEISFQVKEYLYYFDTDKSSARYAEGQGLLVELAEGDTMHFNAVIEMNDLTVNDVLLEAFATPEEQGRFDFKRLYFTFTDVEDPSNYLTFSARHTASSVDAPYSYAMVGGNGQLLTGMEQFNGELKKHVEGTSNFGQSFPHSFKDSTKGTIQFRYDAKALTAYIGVRSIAQLDNPEHFSDLWTGFSSGRVRLSVTAGMYETSTARFCLKEIKGVDLSAGKLEDTTGPVITIDNPYTQMPAAAKGGSYSVFPATARDANTGTCPVKVQVWYNYTAANAAMVEVADGKFTTDRVGNYAIVYEATDRLGNATKQILWVYAGESVTKPTVRLAEEPSAALELGQLLVPAKYSLSCHSGEATLEITAQFDGETVDIADGSFRPEKAGTYTVTYTVSDYIGQTGTASYKVEVKAGDQPVFVDRPAFPAVLIAGCQYTLPELYANDYRSGQLERKLTGAQITDAQGSQQIAPGGTFQPQVENNGDTITAVYSCDGATYTQEIPVIQPWYKEEGSSRPKLSLENYLYSADSALNYVKNDDSITISAKTANGGWSFANQQVAENFNLILRGIGDKSQFDALDITLSDAADPTIAVTLRLVNNGEDKAQLQLGNTQAAAASAFGLGSEFILKYASGSMFVGGTGYAIEADDSGRPFQGFPSGKLVAGIRFVGASQGAAYDLLSVNGYTMSNLASDRTGPVIVVLGEYGGSCSIGQELTIPAAQAGDVLDANTTFHITVTDPAGEVVTATDGTKLAKADPGVGYTIKLDQYGQYNVRLVAADTFNGKANETVLPYTINVDDEEAPVLTFTSDLSDTATVGTVLTLPGFTVEDNVTAQENIVIAKYVYTPSGRLLRLTGDSITAGQAGSYEFRIYVSDEAGNLLLIRKTVTVTEKEGE